MKRELDFQARYKGYAKGRKIARAYSRLSIDERVCLPGEIEVIAWITPLARRSPIATALAVTTPAESCCARLHAVYGAAAGKIRKQIVAVS